MDPYKNEVVFTGISGERYTLDKATIVVSKWNEKDSEPETVSLSSPIVPRICIFLK